MKNKTKITEADFDNILENSLRSQGYLFPENDLQMELFEKNIGQCNTPDKFISPEFVFEGKRKEFNKKELIIENVEDDVNWSIAAREGKELSEEIKLQMIKDREEARKKNGRNK